MQIELPSYMRQIKLICNKSNKFLHYLFFIYESNMN